LTKLRLSNIHLAYQLVERADLLHSRWRCWTKCQWHQWSDLCCVR